MLKNYVLGMQKWGIPNTLFSFRKLKFSARGLCTLVLGLFLSGQFAKAQDINLNLLGSFQQGIFDEGAAEIPAYDKGSKRLFFTNAQANNLVVLDLSNPANPTPIDTIDLSPYGGGVNSVAVFEGLVAVAVEADPNQNPGSVVFFDVNGTFIQSVTVGALPDMLTFTKDGSKVLVANEGEPAGDGSFDPEGSVSIINVADFTVATADFKAFNGREAELRAKGIRIFTPGSSSAQDLEPEYIAISPDGTTAVVTLQENNAVAIINIATAKVIDIVPQGYKDHSKSLPKLEQFEINEAPLDAARNILFGGLSGIFFEKINANGNYQFVCIPDRGPNGEPVSVKRNDGTNVGNVRPFLIPNYQATVYRIELDKANGKVNFLESIPLFRADGTTPISGLANIPGVDEIPVTPVDTLADVVDANGQQYALLPYDELGGDMEGIVINPADNTFWMVDEYRPAIYHFSPNGILIDRFVPQGTGALGGQPAGTYGTETLPNIYNRRRANRGFEGMALDTDKGILYAFIQTPLANPNTAASNASLVIRMLGIDPATGNPVAEYVYLLEKNALNPDPVDKIGDAFYDPNTKRFVVMERDSRLESTAKKFVFDVDLTGATNLLDPAAPALLAGKTLEQHTPNDLAAAGIKPVFKRKILNLPTLGYLPSDKPEGLAGLPDGSMVVLNDNDFGLVPGAEKVALGLITFSDSTCQTGLDASDRDNAINIANWPILGTFHSDAIASYTGNDGKAYYITANEGDARDYDFFAEESRVRPLTLDPTAFPNASSLRDNANLGRLTVTTTQGDLDGDGDYDRLFAFGTRSFTIWDAAANLVYDSGDDLEQITAAASPADFNADNAENGTFDNRSDNKGPEPEGVTTGVINGKTYSFVGLERIGGIVVHDVSDPKAPQFVQYINNRDFSVDAEADVLGAKDLGPEGLVFISAEDSPNGQPLLVVTNEISGSVSVYGIDVPSQNFKLQVLHASDLEGGVDALENAPNFAAIIDTLEGTFDNTLILSSGDNYIPGPFFGAAGDASLRPVFQSVYQTLFNEPGLNNLREIPGRIDISIMNIVGFDASAIGNHEFDAGPGAVFDILATDIRGANLNTVRWLGAQFPYLSANLDFSAESALSALYTPDIRPNTDFKSLPSDLTAARTAPKLAPATIIERGGEKIGVVGATTQLLETITSNGNVEVIGPDVNDMPALAAILQPYIDSLEAMGINKIIVVSHLQQVNLEKALIGLLDGVDIVLAGGSDVIFAQDDDQLRPGNEIEEPYPFITQDAAGNPAVIVGTDGEYSYVGRLIVEFDENGILVESSLNNPLSGAYATLDEVVTNLWGSEDAAFVTGTKGELVRRLTNAVNAIVTTQDGNILGLTGVFLDGRREKVRTEETNLGDLSADANLFVAKQFDPTVQVSIKNGGGIRAAIGEIVDFGGGTILFLPPQANEASGKQEGEISQLDVLNSLRFNNQLSVLSVSAADLLAVVEHGVSASGGGNTPGQFPQIGGMRFSFDPGKPAGARIGFLEIIDENDDLVEVIAQNGQVVGDPERVIRLVTLNFMADGGDGYPFPALGEDRTDLVSVLTDAGASTFSAPGTEQDAMAEYLLANFASIPFFKEETPAEEDTRIVNLSLIQPVLSGFTLIDAATDTPIAAYDPIVEGAVINLTDLPVSRVLNIRANISGNVGSVILQTQKVGGSAVFGFENVAPYAAFGDINGNYNPWRPKAPEGGESYIVKATAYSLPNGEGEELTSSTVTFSFVEGLAAQLASLVLINADTDKEIGELTNGTVVDLAQIGTANLSIMAKTTPSPTGSVAFSLTGPVAQESVENLLPYALFGDKPVKDFNGQEFVAGSYALTVTLFNGPNKIGASSTPVTVNFEVINAAPAARVSFFPNPSEGNVHITSSKTLGAGMIEVTDAMGHVIYQAPFNGKINQSLTLGKSGVYFFRIISENTNEVYRVIRK
ncbi:MAG: choice-of-anchor I family protein [Microscillaceae bacterium]|nr:choice-of-anchor I family protein [Microscillaceae bacterium]